jgi:hypothetical protein
MSESTEELLKAALNLAAIARTNTNNLDEWEAAIAAVEKFNPKPKPLEIWVNVYTDGDLQVHTSKKRGLDMLRVGGRTVHMREVGEPIEWDEWVVREFNSDTAVCNNSSTGEIICYAPNNTVASRICNAHNKEMARISQGV